MKKIFTYLAVAALVAVACDDMYGPVETPVAPDKAGSVEIQIDTLGDDTLAFTLSPVGDAAYYSYFVAAGPAQAVDSAAVYQCKLDGLIKGTFKAAEDSVAHLALGELAPNTPYTIYAVAGSPMGIAGSIAVREVVTTDGITVKLVDYDDTVSDSTIVLTFSEKVYLGEGKVTATYYARNLKYKEMGTVEAVADSVLVEGNTVTVQFAGLPHGADWSIAWPEGTFTDSAKNKVKALVAGQWAKDENGKDVQVGVWSRKDTVAFALEDAFPEEQQMFVEWSTAMFQVGVAVDSTLAAQGKGKVVANYCTPGKVISIDMELKKHYLFGETGVSMSCPEEPSFGTTIVFSFAQDAFQDIWGNPTKAVDLMTLRAYDYTVNTVIGTYAYEAFSAYSETYVNGEWTIEASDDESKGNVMFTKMWSTECVDNVYATFDPAAGKLTVASQQTYASGEKYAYGFSTFDASGTSIKTPAVFSMPEAGVLTFVAETFYVGDAAVNLANGDYLGFFDLFALIEAEKTQAAAPSPAVAVTKIVKSSL